MIIDRSPMRRRAAALAGCLAFTILLGVGVASFQSGAAVSRATTIVGADLADGTGAALRRANVRFVDDRIVGVGDVKPQAGDIVVDGKGLVVAPGFIDIHNHSSSGLAGDPRRRDAGRAGHHDRRRRARRRFAVADRRLPGRAAEAIRPPSTSPSFVGHATVRRQVMKDDYKRPARAGRDRAHGAARRSGDARGRRRAVERPRVRSRRLRRDERARRAREGRRALPAASTCRTSATRPTRASTR